MRSNAEHEKNKEGEVYHVWKARLKSFSENWQSVDVYSKWMDGHNLK